MSNQEIIEKALLVHGDKYDYSMAFCEENKGKMTIICPKHGIFKQSIKRHIGGQGCPICGREKMGRYHKSNVEEISLRGKEIHGARYDYSKVEYKDCDTKVCIICREHGEFLLTPYAHIHRKQGCPKCRALAKNEESLRMRSTEFLLQARELHGDKYDYSKVEYIDGVTKVCIVCPIHGEFWQKPVVHLMGCGCQKCANESTKEKQMLSKEEFLQRANIAHNAKYDYSLVDYKGYYSPVQIICPIHGVFEQKTSEHIKGKGCQKCAIEARRKKRMLTLETFIGRSIKIHGEKYDYSKTVYTHALDKVEIMCPIHGSFWQAASAHMNGDGCPKCSCSHGEQQIQNILDNYNVEYIQHYRIETELRLFGKNPCFIVDFFLPKENLVVEFNGIQHYEIVERFHRIDSDFIKQKERDKKLRGWCKDNNIKLLEIKYDQIKHIEDILKQHINFDKYEKDYTQTT